MRKQRTDLRPFNMAQLNQLRRRRQAMRNGKSPREFWNELEQILSSEDYITSDVWERLKNDDVVLGEVWSQPIGTFSHKNKVHQYTYLYVQSSGLAIDEHSHEEEVHWGKHTMKMSEWYIFSDGRMELCRKNEKHKLINDSDDPIYVIAVRIRSRKTT